MRCRCPDCAANMFLWHPPRLSPWESLGFQAEGCTSHLLRAYDPSRERIYGKNSGCLPLQRQQNWDMSLRKEKSQIHYPSYTQYSCQVLWWRLALANAHWHWVGRYLSRKILFDAFFLFKVEKKDKLIIQQNSFWGHLRNAQKSFILTSPVTLWCKKKQTLCFHFWSVHPFSVTV